MGVRGFPRRRLLTITALPMTPTLQMMRKAAGRARRTLFPSPEVAAWRHACRVAARIPRRQHGEIELAGYRIAYTDLLSLCPQWHDFFVDGILRFSASSETPRILDCGANVGLASLYFKRIYPRARITAYEADPAIAAVARRNFAQNGLHDIEVRQAALWTSDGDVTFRSDGADGGAIDDAGHGGALARVPAIRLRSVLDGERVDLLKLDIEGAESDVLADCEPALAGVEALLLDVHEFDASRRRLPSVLTLLERAGFTYSMTNLMELPWLGAAPAGTPFAGRATKWALGIRAWRR